MPSPMHAPRPSISCDVPWQPVVRVHRCSLWLVAQLTLRGFMPNVATLHWRRLLDLATQVQAKYSLDKTQAQRDVDAFAKGRQL